MRTIKAGVASEEDMMYVYLDIVKNFSCSQCGACCRNDWLVTVDELGYKRNSALFFSKGRETEFMEAFVPLREEADFGEYAKITKKNSGGCWFLTDENLCGLQQMAGHEHLDTVCQWFPRYPMNTERGIELSLSFSCPAALQLAAREEPLQIVRSELSPIDWMPQEFVNHVYPSQYPANNALHYYFEIEGHLIDVLQARKIRLKDRLAITSQCMGKLDKLNDPATMGRDIDRLFLEDYARIDAAAPAGEEETGAVQWLAENYFVNFIFRKSCYNQGFVNASQQLEVMHDQLDNCLLGQRHAADVDEVSRIIVKLEMDYNHKQKSKGCNNEKEW